MPMYNSIKHSGNYSKISGSLWRYYRDEPALMITALLKIFLAVVIHLNLR